MAMISAASNGNGPMMEMNATPLIDVMLVLLIMFIITVPILTHSVQLLTPGEGNAPPAQELYVRIEYGGDVTLNGRLVNAQELERSFQQARTHTPQPFVKVDANPRARYEVFAQVLAMAQRNGMQRLSIVPHE